jgi:hypothetical protein
VRQLLQHQLRDVAAAVGADVDDQPLAVHLGPQVPAEVRPAGPHHVRDVQVAETAVAELAGVPPAPGHPVLVAQPPVAGQRQHGDVPLRGSGAHGQLDRLPGRVGQQRRRAVHRVHRLPVHRHQQIAGPYSGTGGGQR